jgi:hypothetical protein
MVGMVADTNMDLVHEPIRRLSTPTEIRPVMFQ